ncbi:MAG: hypothetical protein GF308_14470 [Candidatus Heimdallarchaeota archaeon]|nr:hypothetical protein [Candidatus Heimdallarchaeota archaeon]
MNKKKGIILLTLLFLFVFFPFFREPRTISQQTSLDLLLDWSFYIGESVFSSPCAADLNADGYLETIICDHNRTIYCLSQQGTLLWTYSFQDYTGFSSTPCIIDLDDDDKLEIIICDSYNNTYCINWKGQLKWVFSSAGDINLYSSPCIVDLDNNSLLEVLILAKDALYCLDNQGQLNWFFPVNETIWPSSSPSVIDIDSDGKLEVLVGIHTHLFCLSNTGVINWNFTTNYQIHSSPSIANLVENQNPNIIFGTRQAGGARGQIICLNNSGQMIWSYSSPPVSSSPVIVDLDNDLSKEVLVSAGDKVLCLNKHGLLKWQYTTQSVVDSSPTVADLNGDNQMEIIFGSWDNNTYCLNNEGGVICQYLTEGEIWASVFIADLNHDHKLEIIVVSNIIYKPYRDIYPRIVKGKVYCFTLAGVSHSGIVPYHGFRGSLFQTGWMDSDGDFLDDLTENYFFHLNSSVTDSDQDNLMDGEEVLFYNTDPLKVDTDGDFLLDDEEILLYGTDPNRSDSDEDGFSDYEEINSGTNPLKRWSNPKNRRIFTITTLTMAVIILITVVFFTVSTLHKSIKKSRLDLITQVDSLLPEQTLEWFRKLNIPPKVFVAQQKTINQFIERLILHWEKQAQFPKEITSFQKDNSLLENNDALFCGLKVLINHYPLQLSELSSKKIMALDRASKEVIALFNISLIEKQEIPKNKLFLILFRTSFSFIEAKIVIELIQFLLEKSLNLSSIPSLDLDFDHLGCKLLKLNWEHRKNNSSKKALSLLEISEKLEIGFLSTIQLIQILNKELLPPKSHFVTDQNTLDSISYEKDFQEITIKSYAETLFDLFQEKAVDNILDLGEVATKLNILSIKKTVAIISRTIEHLLLQNPEAVMHTLDLKTPITEISIREQWIREGTFYETIDEIITSESLLKK